MDIQLHKYIDERYEVQYAFHDGVIYLKAKSDAEIPRWNVIDRVDNACDIFLVL